MDIKFANSKVEVTMNGKKDFIGTEDQRTDYIRRAVAERILELCDKRGYTVNQLI